jgi:hypothetical protein
MSARLQNQQLDLLHRVAMSTDREWPSPVIRSTIIGLLKQLLSECVTGAATTRPVDE